MDWANFLKHNLSKLTEGETETLNSPMSIKEMEFTIENFFTMKVPDLSGFTFEFLLIFREKIILILHIFFQKIEEGTLTNWYEAIITLIQNSKRTLGK